MTMVVGWRGEDLQPLSLYRLHWVTCRATSPVPIPSESHKHGTKASTSFSGLKNNWLRLAKWLSG